MQIPQPTRDYSHLLAGILNALCGLFWTIAYVLYVFQARLDSSYGMLVIALIMNLAWEIVHTFIYPMHGVGRFFHFPWVFVDWYVTASSLTTISLIVQPSSLWNTGVWTTTVAYSPIGGW